MYNKLSFLTLALILHATASPVVEDFGVRIPFHKRSALTNCNGTFDHAKAVRQVVRDHNKHITNLKNIEANVGREAFNEGAEIKLPMSYSAPERRQSVPLNDEQNDLLWAGNINVGTPLKQFYIDFDTGSSDLWFPSINCTASACSSKHKYSAKASSTSKSLPGTFSILYGDGSTVSGPIYSDTVVVGGITAKNQAFSAVTSLSSSFGSEPIDGILGMAYPSLSTLRQPPFVNSAKAQGAIKQAVFGMKLAKSGSELYIGGTNTGLYTGSPEYTTSPATPDSGSSVTAVVSNISTVVDSGTTLIYGPPSAVAQFYTKIPGWAVYDAKVGFYSFPCANTPSNVAFSWGGGKAWTISPQNFNLGTIGNNRCVGAILGRDLGLGTNVWLLGDSFMKNVYTAFSFESNSVGFATLK